MLAITTQLIGLAVIMVALEAITRNVAKFSTLCDQI